MEDVFGYGKILENKLTQMAAPVIQDRHLPKAQKVKLGIFVFGFIFRKVFQFEFSYQIMASFAFSDYISFLYIIEP